MTEKQRKNLLAKLRRPVHVDYISRYILNCSIEEAMIEINQLINENILEESCYSKNYYVVKKNEEEK